MKCLICNRLMRTLFQGSTGLLECPYCGYVDVIHPNIVITKVSAVSSTVSSYIRKVQPIHE